MAKFLVFCVDAECRVACGRSALELLILQYLAISFLFFPSRACRIFLRLPFASDSDTNVCHVNIAVLCFFLSFFLKKKNSRGEQIHHSGPLASQLGRVCWWLAVGPCPGDFVVAVISTCLERSVAFCSP